MVKLIDFWLKDTVVYMSCDYTFPELVFGYAMHIFVLVFDDMQLKKNLPWIISLLDSSDFIAIP